MPICMLKRGDLCDRMFSCENEARFLYQNDLGKFVQQRNKMAAKPQFVLHACTGSPTQTQN